LGTAGGKSQDGIKVMEQAALTLPSGDPEGGMQKEGGQAWGIGWRRRGRDK